MENCQNFKYLRELFPSIKSRYNIYDSNTQITCYNATYNHSDKIVKVCIIKRINGNLYVFEEECELNKCFSMFDRIYQFIPENCHFSMPQYQKLSKCISKIIKCNKQPVEVITKPVKTDVITYTYIMKDCANNLYKIGKSIHPERREKTLQSEKPSIKMIKVFNCDIEKKLHKLYKNYRIRGEWFKLSNIQLEYICRHF